MKRILLILVLTTIAISASYFAYNEFQKNKVSIPTPTTEKTPPQQQSPIETPTIPDPKPETITYNEKPTSVDANYFEKVVRVETEFVYFAYPLVVPKENPPKLIVYSHGSNTTISKNFNDPFMKDMQMYGEYFTKRGYAFSASNMHGANWGSDIAVEDINTMYDWISQKYLVDKKINLFGFSMGGLPTLNFAFKYPSNVNSIALLAPTSRDYSQSQFESIRRIPIQIWHGDKDVNVPLSLTLSLHNRYTKFGYKNLDYEIIEGKGHFDIDTELRKEVLEFFNEHE